MLVERAGDHRVQQQSGVVGGEPLDHELRQPLEHLLVAGSRTAKTKPTRSAKSRRATNASVCDGHPVEPLRVVDDAHERLLLGGLGEQAQDRQPDEEPIGWRSGAQAERRAQRVALRVRQLLETAEHGRAQRVQAGERELHLGLDASRPDDRHPSAASGTCRRSAVLPAPASPRSTSTWLWPARTPATSRSSTPRSLARSTKPDDSA